MIFPEARVPGEIYGTWGKDAIGAVQDWGLGGIITSTILILPSFTGMMAESLVDLLSQKLEMRGFPSDPSKRFV